MAQSQHRAPFTRIDWFTLARRVWVGLAALQVILFLAGVYYREEHALGLAIPQGTGPLLRAGFTPDFYPTLVVILEGAFLAALLVLSGMILFSQIIGPVGLLASFALAGFGPTIVTTTRHLMASDPLWWTAGTLVSLSGHAVAIPLLYHIPDGYRQPAWTHWASALWVITAVAAHLSPASSPWHMSDGPLYLVAAALQFLVAIGVQVSRYRSLLNAGQRLQIRWVLFGIATAVISMNLMTWVITPHLHTLFPDSVAVTVLRLASPYFFLLLVPVSSAIAILQHRIWDMRFLLQRTLTYAALTALVIGLYVLVVVGFGSLLRAPGSPILSPLAVGVVAVLIMPMQVRLQRLVNQVVYGQRDEPYALISRLGRRLESAVEPESMLQTIVEEVAGALKLPYAVITIREGSLYRTAATYGHEAETGLVVPLIYQAEQVGELKLAPRVPGEPWSNADRALLAELARPAGAAAHAVRLNCDLRTTNASLASARERLVTAREEERRRLRQQLHDGLSPTLAAFTLKIGAIRRLLQRDAEGADRLLVELSKEMEVTVSDIRRLVHNLRPPALDQVGLLEALRARTASLWQGAELPQIDLDLPEELPTLPAAVEVAAYLIAQEALANALSHANAERCTLRLRYDQRFLRVAVTDDGDGLPPERPAGVGILTMRERAQELGGILKIGPAPGGGTRVEAYLPVQPPERSENP